MGAADLRPWEGPRKCKWDRKGLRCGSQEIDGLEFCVQHVPDEDLDEAEEISGIRRCRHHFGDEDACRNYAVAWTVPAACKVHGANAGSVQRGHAANREYEA